MGHRCRPRLQTGQHSPGLRCGRSAAAGGPKSRVRKSPACLAWLSSISPHEETVPPTLRVLLLPNGRCAATRKLRLAFSSARGV
jgi:hypothetical protein